MRALVGIAALVCLLANELSAQRFRPLAAAPDAPAFQLARVIVSGRLYLTAIALDAGGNIYVAGGTSASDLPALNAEMPKRGGLLNAFVMKLDPAGRPLWSSIIGGTGSRPNSRAEHGGDYALAIAVDPSGQATITGKTFSTNFPTVNAFIGAPQGTTPTYGDGFVAKLSSDGKRLIYSSYFGGGNGDSSLSAVATGPAGEVWIAGSSTSTQIATHFDIADRDSNHVIVLKLNPAGGVVWSTRMSGAYAYDLAVDGLGQAHVAAGCWALNDARPGSCNPFVAKLSASGTQQLYRERVSSVGNEPIRLSLDAAGQVAVAGKYGVAATADPWPGAWGLGGFGFVRTLDPLGRTLSSNTVNVTATQRAVHAALGDRLLVAFNTGTAGLPTERAVVSQHVDGPFYTSADGAATWANIGGPFAARSLHIDAEREQLFAVSPTASYRSDDRGQTWRRDDVYPHFAIDPRQPRIQWRATGPVYRRVDGGSWQPVRFVVGPSPNTVETIAVSPHDGSAWVSGDFGVQVVTDEGRASRFENEGLPPATPPGAQGFVPPHAFAFDPGDPHVVYAATRAGLYARFGSTGGWQHLTAQLGGLALIGAVAVAPTNSNVLLIGRRDGMYRSDDRGRSWQQVMSGTEIRTTVWDPNRAGGVYASGQRLYRSLDHGVTWQTTAVGYESRFAPSAIAINARTSQLYVSSEAIQPIAFVMEVSGSGAAYRRSWATYIEDGEIFDVATTSSGAVIGLLIQDSDSRSEVAIARIGR